MAKQDNSFLNGILTFAAVFGGLYLSAELLKLFATKETYYTCANCGQEIEPEISKCPNCKKNIKWEQTKIQPA